MKVTGTEVVLDFKRFDITITVESIDDAIKLYCLFNYSPTVEALDLDIDAKVRELITKNVDRRLSYHEMFMKMEDSIKKRYSK